MLLSSEVAIVVVTYNRKNKLEICIDKLLKQTYQNIKIYIVDNHSNDGTHEFLNSLLLTADCKISYIRLTNNLGGAGGFSEGIRHAIEDGCEYIWGMDDDAFPNTDALENLMNHVRRFPQNTCFWSNCDNDNAFKNEYKEVTNWMFVGFLIPVSIVKKINLPRKDFFIYYDDYEYAKRIISYGFKIYKVKSSIIQHNSYEQREILKRKVFNKQIAMPLLNDWKLYYFCRNRILASSFLSFNYFKTIFRDSLKILIKIVILNPKQIPIVFIAIFHGIIRKSGKYLIP